MASPTVLTDSSTATSHRNGSPKFGRCTAARPTLPETPGFSAHLTTFSGDDSQSWAGPG